MMKAILIAFSTYSKIPMPHFKWDPKALQYSMCAFPLVGAVIGAGEFVIWYLFGFLLQWSEVFTAALLTIFPILITGGIHMDGFLDTVDAKSSYKSKEEKLQILKDPHTGAFAIIRGCLYFLIYFGCMYELVTAGIAILMFFYYRFMSYRTLGGITGDLAGYFLQMCELWMLIGTVVLVHVI